MCPCFEYVSNDKQSDTASEGTLLHEAMAKDDPSKLENEDQKLQYEKMQQYLGGQRAEYEGKMVLEFKELRLSIIEGVKGSLDHALVNVTDRKAKILDWKTGRLGLPVAAKDSYQLRSYFLGFMRSEHGKEVDEVEVHLVCPRTDEVEVFIYKASDVSAVMSDIMALVAKVDDPFKKPCSSKPDMCGHCGNAGRCPLVSTALTPVVQGAIPTAAPRIFAPVETFSPEELGMFLTVEKLAGEWFEQRKKAVTTRVFSESIDVPGYKRVTRSGGTRLTDESGGSMVYDTLKLVLTLDEILECSRPVLSKLQSLERDNVMAALEPFLERGQNVTYLQKSRKTKAIE